MENKLLTVVDSENGSGTLLLLVQLGLSNHILKCKTIFTTR
jgi:hypothetical protein